MAGELSTEYVRNKVDVQEIPEPDNLISGLHYDVGIIRINEAGSYERGQVMASAGDNVFVKASAENIQSAKELAVLADELELPEGKYTKVCAYFTGMFKNAGLKYEGVDEEALVPAMRKMKMFVV